MAPTRRTALASAGLTLGSLTAVSGCLDSAGDADVSCPPSVPTDASLRIGFVGDVMLGRSVDERWHDAPDGPTAVWGSILDRLQSLDGLVANLECCVSNHGEPRPGRTFHFRASPEWAVPALERASVSCAGLANNHLLDFGPAALTDTPAHLDDAGIASAGAGVDRETAFEPAAIEISELSVAVVAVTDQSSSYAAGRDSPGTAYAPLDPNHPLTRRRVGGALAAARDADPDLLVVTAHWGPNWVTEPAETQQAFARWLVDNGADVVHGHSAHVIQGVEVYRGRPIMYDTGNFVDDYAIKDGYRNDRSFLFELHIDDGRLAALELTPVENAYTQVRHADDTVAEWLRETVRERSRSFGTTIERNGRGLRIPLSCPA
ncbi:CapA family protein [Haloarcula japonica]|uniref:Poly-gamma-glutamate synthesis protein n=1 Tax=Haloarcula japonica (strain ATCC 49778 / DSM 6131 / JCM 7785 / NBRC 101032 / NCIMB 13157 / TR-1) TaxID=1227453 RepID=M0L9U8_HALJT|nr:CapA family protein [Haloarcula japonica]EMA29868.1 poly-gamma-glutamate synthesis protein [Haloarcula japonica DSM 6131]